MNQEGVIKFRFEHEGGVCCADADIADLEQWRAELRGRGWLGQDPIRYGGLGFGNLSKRMPDGNFLITGSQTGHREKLTAEDYVRIQRFDPVRNLIWSKGLKKSSSETMTHMAVYQSIPAANYVFHTHCPELWAARKDLSIPATDPGIEYGTTEMYYEVQNLLSRRQHGQKDILAMAGHRDGIITWGKTAKLAGDTLLLLASELHDRAA